MHPEFVLRCDILRKFLLMALPSLYERDILVIWEHLAFSSPKQTQPRKQESLLFYSDLLRFNRQTPPEILGFCHAIWCLIITHISALVGLPHLVENVSCISHFHRNVLDLLLRTIANDNLVILWHLQVGKLCNHQQSVKWALCWSLEKKILVPNASQFIFWSDNLD